MARDRWAPFDRLLAADLPTRAALARVLAGTLGGGHRAFVTIDNKAEGSAAIRCPPWPKPSSPCLEHPTALTITAVDYPDYNPDYDTPALTDAELDALDSLLQALPADSAMNVEGLDGYLTALLVGPPLLGRLKSADWLPVVWGGDGAGEGAAPFTSQKQRKRAAMLVLRHLHAIDQQLRTDPEAWEPVFSIAETPEREVVDAEDWCVGFLQAVALDSEAWAPLFDDPALGPALVPIALLGGDDSLLSETDAERLADPEQRDTLSRAVVDAVLRLHARLQTPPHSAQAGVAGGSAE